MEQTQSVLQQDEPKEYGQDESPANDEYKTYTSLTKIDSKTDIRARPKLMRTSP